MVLTLPRRVVCNSGTIIVLGRTGVKQERAVANDAVAEGKRRGGGLVGSPHSPHRTGR